MADVHNTATRRYNMSKIKGTNTKPELLVRRYLHAKGLRYRLHNKNLPGKPDITLTKLQTVIFVNGCFWHGHEGCKYFVMPKTKSEWWQKKINETIKRDCKSVQNLKGLGWNPFVIWECELKPEKRESSLRNLYDKVIKEKNYNNAK